MAILKSEIIGKPISKLIGVNTRGDHPIWYNFTVDAVDFLFRCTLRYVNSYGASYKIDPTSELTIIHSNGTRYPVDSYKKLLSMIITDYDEPQEQPMSIKPQPGTHWERLQYFTVDSPKGEIITISCASSDTVGWYGPLGYVTRPITEFKELFKPRPDLDTPSSEPTLKRKLAFYKESGKSWTYEEYINISEYCGDKPSENHLDRFRNQNSYKYVYDDGDSYNFMYNWNSRTPEKHPEYYTILSYEYVFGTPTKSTKTTKPVAQLEPITPTPIKESFMSKIKDSASATVDQNKQALVIASKMEAGRIINKQVLKQLTPHLPFFLQGYAKSPFAPFVAANLVAMVANHTGNSKLTKVSDLMLLGAADSGIVSFNLDKIVDDILSNIKLPAGVLDDSDDE